MREDQLEALEMEPRLLAVFRKKIPQFRCMRCIPEPRQRAKHLGFGGIEVGQLVEIEIFEGSKSHEWGLLRTESPGDYARAMPHAT